MPWSGPARSVGMRRSTLTWPRLALLFFVVRLPLKWRTNRHVLAITTLDRGGAFDVQAGLVLYLTEQSQLTTPIASGAAVYATDGLGAL